MQSAVVTFDNFFEVPDYYNNKLVIIFFDIQKKDEKTGVYSSGDSCLIRTPDGFTMLIDGGFEENSDTIVSFLSKMNIFELDAVFVSHLHSDHILGIPGVLKEVPAKRAYLSKVQYNSKPSVALFEALENANVPIEYLKRGDEFSLGEFVEAEILHPDVDEPIYFDASEANKSYDINDLSLVLKLTYDETSYLFTGDVHTFSELKLIEIFGEDIKVNVIKVPHHGSASSSSVAFVEAVTPQFSFIPHYGVPNAYNRYKKISDTFTSGLNGTVIFASDGSNIDCFWEKGNAK